MLPDRVSNPGPLAYESGALPIALRGPADPSCKIDLDFWHCLEGKKAPSHNQINTALPILPIFIIQHYIHNEIGVIIEMFIARNCFRVYYIDSKAARPNLAITHIFKTCLKL